MPNKTIYIREEDLAVFEQAQKDGGESISAIVTKALRHYLSQEQDRKTIADFGARISAKAGQSSNYELVTKIEKLGGNGPIMANAMAAGGVAVSYVGALGYPKLHPVFDDFANVAEVFSVAEPGYTDALEFSDGKLMLGKHDSIRNLDWDAFREGIGADVFAQIVKRAKLIGMTNWTMLPKIESVYEAIDQLLASGDAGDRKLIFVDLADPAKRNPDDIRGVLRLLGHVDLALGQAAALCLTQQAVQAPDLTT